MENEPFRSRLFSFAFIFLLPAILSPGVIGALALIGLLLYSSALISGSEIAFFSLTHNDFARLREENTLSSNRILNLKEKPRTLLATILISNNFINVAIVVVSEFIVKNLLPEGTFEAWAQKAMPYATTFTEPQIAKFFSFFITVIGVTFLLVLFGEVAPKIYAKLNNIRLARRVSGLLSFLMRLFWPFSYLLVKGTNLIEIKLEATTQGNATPSREDIDEAIELTVSQEKDVAEQEIDILRSILKFGDVAVKQIMCSRVDVIALDKTTTFKEVLETAKNSGFSRIPIFEEDFDHVTGILYVKDLLSYLGKSEDFHWQGLVRKNVLYVPESKKINELLKEFQAERMHLAIVVDEYGGSAGIVTLEDIMEEVIGEIRDEFDDEEEVDYTKIDDYTYQFEGKTLLNDVCRLTGLDTEVFDKVRGDADSVAGLILEKAGHIPRKHVEFLILDYKFKIVAVNRRRIEQVLVTLPKE